MSTEILLIDLSSLAHPIWHQSQAEPDPNATSQKVVARVRALASEHKHAAVCCDSGRSFRKDISDAYKANRPESDASLQHQIRLACEQLAADGFPIWRVPNFEADDLIASAAVEAIKRGHTVLVVSADKDLLQLVDPCVRQKRPDTGAILDEAGVRERFGVKPGQMRDYLALVGDASDNIKGCKGVGQKRAVELLAAFGTVEGIFAAVDADAEQFTPSMLASLQEFRDRAPMTLQLVELRYDVAIPFEEVERERVSQDTEAFNAEIGDDMQIEEPADLPFAADAVLSPEPARTEPSTNSPTAPAIIVPSAPVEVAPPASYQLQLDPRSMSDARVLAKDMHASRMFSAYGTPQGVLATIMLGRELGLPAMASLRQIHVIEGKQSLSAQLMVALVLKSGMAEYFEPLEFNDQIATFETKRRGARNPVTLTHTIAMAEKAGLLKDKSNWLKVPTDMLVARAQSRLCRLVYPDIVGGLYTPDELIDMRDAIQAA